LPTGPTLLTSIGVQPLPKSACNRRISSCSCLLSSSSRVESGSSMRRMRAQWQAAPLTLHRPQCPVPRPPPPRWSTPIEAASAALDQQLFVIHLIFLEALHPCWSACEAHTDRAIKVTKAVIKKNLMWRAGYTARNSENCLLFLAFRTLPSCRRDGGVPWVPGAGPLSFCWYRLR
jgi:hypothetical protein